MQRSKYKVIKIKKDEIFLEEESGYFCNLNGLRVFIYHNFRDNYWHSIDLKTGLPISKGNTMVRVKSNTIDKLLAFKKIQETEKYKKHVIEYQKLLKKGRNRWVKRKSKKDKTVARKSPLA